MTKWSYLDDLWDPAYPAVARGREALALRPPEEPAITPAPADPVAEVAALTARIRAGDRSAVERLRALLGRLGHG